MWERQTGGEASIKKFLALIIVAFAMLMGAAVTTEALALSPDAFTAIADMQGRLLARPR